MNKTKKSLAVFLAVLMLVTSFSSMTAFAATKLIKTVSFAQTNYTYTGKVSKPTSMTVKDSSGKTVSSKYYTVYYSNSNSKYTGKYKATIKGKNGYSGTVIKYYYICPKVTINNAKYYYSTSNAKKSLKPSVTVKDSKGKTISSKYYTVKYADPNYKVGKHSLRVYFSAPYSGSILRYFYVYPSAPSGMGVIDASKTSVKISWNHHYSETTGFQVQRATDSKFTKNVKTTTLKSYKDQSYPFTGLNTVSYRYYFRIRTYKTVSGVNYYSGWSNGVYCKGGKYHTGGASFKYSSDKYDDDMWYLDSYEAKAWSKEEQYYKDKWQKDIVNYAKSKKVDVYHLDDLAYNIAADGYESIPANNTGYKIWFDSYKDYIDNLARNKERYYYAFAIRDGHEEMVLVGAYGPMTCPVYKGVTEVVKNGELKTSNYLNFKVLRKIDGKVGYR